MGSQKDKQLAILKSGLLNKIGRKKVELNLNVTQEILVEAGKYIVSSLQDNLKSNGIDETSSLYQSIDYQVISQGTFIILTVSMNKYYIFVDKGVKGKESGSSKGGFAYTNKMPPLSAFVGPQGWISRKGISSIAGIPMNSKTNKTGAYIVRQSVFKKGIKSTDFYSSVVTNNLFNVIQEAVLEQSVNLLKSSLGNENK